MKTLTIPNKKVLKERFGCLQDGKDIYSLAYNIFFEKPKGLDFTMRDTSLLKKAVVYIMAIAEQQKNMPKRFLTALFLMERISCWILDAEKERSLRLLLNILFKK